MAISLRHSVNCDVIYDAIHSTDVTVTSQFHQKISNKHVKKFFDTMKMSNFMRILTIMEVSCLISDLTIVGGVSREKRWSKPKGESLETTKVHKFSWVEPFTKLNPEIQSLMKNPKQKKLQIIGPFLAAHKYFEIDQRYTFRTGKEYIKPKFYKHFPIPRLRALHKSVQGACEQGPIQCIDEVYSKAKISKSTAKIHRKFYYMNDSIPDAYPFRSRLDMFRYRATASYYLCWYTDQQSDVLAFTAGGDCLQNMSLVLEAKNRKVRDFRERYSGSQYTLSPFTCAFLWFCPDPCYGKSSSGNVPSRKKARKDPTNPCKSLKEKSCSWVVGQNSNFEDLKKNKFNYTCNCTSEKAGFKWSPLYGICIDRDECYDAIADCPEQKVCRNTIGSYMCTCRRGFHENLLTGLCEKSEMFRASEYKSIQQRPKEEKKSGFVKFAELVLGISNKATQLSIETVLLYLIMLNIVALG